VASAVALTSGLVVPAASADQISDLRAQASALAARIQQLGQQEEALAEQYDGDQLTVQSLEAKVSQAAQQVAAADATTSRARNALRQAAINAYVQGNSSPLSAGGGGVTSATNSLLGAEYVNSLATDQADAIDQFHLAAVQDQTARANLQQQTRQAQQAVQQVARDRQQVSNTQVELQAEFKQDTGQIAVLVQQQQQAEAAAAAAAARARLLAAQQAAAAAAAAQQAAAQQASNPSVVSAPSPGFGPPPPVGHGASGAVAAALSRIGDPYVWGAAGPNTFDCSGLVMWSYAQVGISLPHFSGAQYADTTHISMADLQPGDLVFPSDPGQHVAMYVGIGMIVQAPYTGADVQEVPLSSFFVLASRVT
jgi:cell wall-associated NlpC family hydrolase